MHLEGSCHCGSVHFSVECAYPYPFNQCYCSICRKTAGGGGYAITLGGSYETLKVDGEENLSIYRVMIKDAETGEDTESPVRRNFCKKCASTLWIWDTRWPEFVYPFASAIDSELPVPPEHTHMMLDSKANWVEVRSGSKDCLFKEYPNESLAQWHQRLGVDEQEG